MADATNDRNAAPAVAPSAKAIAAAREHVRLHMYEVTGDEFLMIFGTKSADFAVATGADEADAVVRRIARALDAFAEERFAEEAKASEHVAEPFAGPDARGGA